MEKTIYVKDGPGRYREDCVKTIYYIFSANVSNLDLFLETAQLLFSTHLHTAILPIGVQQWNLGCCLGLIIVTSICSLKQLDCCTLLTSMQPFCRLVSNSGI